MENIIAHRLKNKISASQFSEVDYIHVGKCNSQAFLDTVSTYINMEELYKIKSTCLIDDEQEFCPIQLEIAEPSIRRHYKGKFLLQVWSNTKKKVFEKVLNKEVKYWSINYNFFFYQPAQGDTDDDFMFVVDLSQNATYKIKDFADSKNYKHSAFMDGYLYIASDSNLKILQITDSLTENETVEIIPDQTNIKTCTPGLKIHGLFAFIDPSQDPAIRAVLIQTETTDFQLDFSRIQLQGEGINSSQRIGFIQLMEFVPRKIEFDQIKKVVNVGKGGNFTSVAIRQSGAIDIYFNMIRIDSPPLSMCKVDDIEPHFDGLVFKFSDRSGLEIVDIDLQEKMHYENSTPYIETKDLSQVFLHKIKNYVDIFGGWYLENYGVHIAHGPFVSSYQLTTKKFVKHTLFESSIKRLFKKVDFCNFMNFGVLLDNNKIYSDLRSDRQNSDVTVLEPAEAPQFEIEGNILFTHVDNKYSFNFLVIHEVSGQVKLSNLVVDSLKEQEGVTGLDVNSKVIYVVDEGFDDFIFVHTGNKLTLYQNDEDTEQYAVYNDFVLENDAFQDAVFHACTTSSLEDFICLSTTVDFIKVDMKTKEIDFYKDQNVLNVRLCDSKFLYGLSPGNNEQPEGVYLYNFNNIIELGVVQGYQLMDACVGCSHMDFNFRIERLAILTDLTKMSVLPLLHRNTMSLIGSITSATTLVQREVMEQFSVLSKFQQLITWSIVSTNVIKNTVIPKEILDCEKYEPFVYCNPDVKKKPFSDYLKGWFDFSLLKSIEPKQMMGGERDRPNIQGQTTFLAGQKKEHFEFKIVKIENSSSISILRTFIHPLYYGDLQDAGLYFSENMDYMIEVVNRKRINLFQWDFEKKRYMKIKRMENLEVDMRGSSKFPVPFTPDCLKYLDFDFRNKVFIIRDTITEQIVGRIPKHLMTVEDGETLTQVMNRFKWQDNDTFLYVDREGIERIVQPSLDSKILGFGAIASFNIEECLENHFYFNPKYVHVKDSLQRFINTSRKFKRCQQIYKLTEPKNLHDQMFSVDYLAGEFDSRIRISISFSYVHWRIIEQLQKQEITLEMLDKETIDGSVFCILPDGSTALHHLHSQADVIEQIFKNNLTDPDDITSTKNDIPFVRNIDSYSPLDICLNQGEISTADLILRYLGGFGFDHHSRTIDNALPKIIELQLPALQPYLDSRIQENSNTKKITRGAISEDNYGILSTNFRFDPIFAKGAMFAKKTQGQQEQEINCRIIDIPKMHDYQEDVGNQFFDALADCPDYELFSNMAIRKMIEFKYPLVKEYTIKKLFIPYLIFLVTFMVYVNIVYQISENAKFDLGQKYAYSTIWIVDVCFNVVLFVFSIYFLQNEVLQLIADGMNYLKSPWNYIDIIPPCMNIAVITTNIANEYIALEATTLHVILAVACFFMWMKLLYFLRIFESTGYLISMIIEVISDMKTFFLILAITIVAFGDSMLLVNLSNPQDQRFIDEQNGRFVGGVTFAYLIALGDWDTGNFGTNATWVVWILFFLNTLFNLVVMFNLLISIISDTFARVTENAQNAGYKDKACMVSENEYLIPEYRKNEHVPKDTWMVFSVNKSDDLTISDPIADEIEILKNKVTAIEGFGASMDNTMKDLFTQNSELRILVTDFNTQLVTLLAEKSV